MMRPDRRQLGSSLNFQGSLKEQVPAPQTALGLLACSQWTDFNLEASWFGVGGSRCQAMASPHSECLYERRREGEGRDGGRRKGNGVVDPEQSNRESGMNEQGLNSYAGFLMQSSLTPVWDLVPHRGFLSSSPNSHAEGRTTASACFSSVSTPPPSLSAVRLCDKSARPCSLSGESEIAHDSRQGTSQQDHGAQHVARMSYRYGSCDYYLRLSGREQPDDDGGGGLKSLRTLRAHAKMWKQRNGRRSRTCQAERPMIRNRRLLLLVFLRATKTATMSRNQVSSRFAFWPKRRKGKRERKKDSQLLSGTTGTSTRNSEPDVCTKRFSHGAGDEMGAESGSF